LLKNELYVTLQKMQHPVLPVSGHGNYFLAGWAFSSMEWHYLISCCWLPYHRAHRKPVLFAEYLGINLEDAVTHKSEEGLAVIVFRDLLVCIPAKVDLEKYSESVLYVLHWHLLQFVIFYEVPLRLNVSVSAAYATSGLVAC
jgi:hypothetical protein